LTRGILTEIRTTAVVFWYYRTEHPDSLHPTDVSAVDLESVSPVRWYRSGPNHRHWSFPPLTKGGSGRCFHDRATIDPKRRAHWWERSIKGRASDWKWFNGNRLWWGQENQQGNFKIEFFFEITQFSSKKGPILKKIEFFPKKGFISKRNSILKLFDRTIAMPR
jgi:hypothetical protein